MPSWLLLDVDLQFSAKLGPVFARDYRPDVVTEDNDSLYYGMHFLSAPAKINPGDCVAARIVLRAFPKDPCRLFQPAKRILVKEGSITRAEGRIVSRLEYQSATQTVAELIGELGEKGIQ